MIKMKRITSNDYIFQMIKKDRIYKKIMDSGELKDKVLRTFEYICLFFAVYNRNNKKKSNYNKEISCNL